MIYVHVIWQIHDVKTDIQVSGKEMPLKSRTREEHNNDLLQRVMALRDNNLEYPGNGKFYGDMLEKELTAAGKKFCGIPD